LEIFTLRGKVSGLIITIFASTNEAVCHEVQTDFWSFLCASFIHKFWAHFLDFYIKKWSCLLLSSDAFWKLWLYQVYEESFRRNLTIYASKNEAFCCWVQTLFRSSLPARFTEKVLGTFLWFMCPKMKFPAKFGRISEVFTLRGIQLKFWAHYHDFCVHERRCLPWSSDRFWRLYPCKLYKKVMGALSRFMCPKTKLFAGSPDAFMKFSTFKVYKKISGCIFTIFASKNEAVCCEIQTDFGSFPHASFIKKIWAHFLDFCV